jgi:hypothetical protein
MKKKERKQERKRLLDEAKQTGSYTVYQDAVIYCNYKEILDEATNPIEFKKIWDKLPDASKMYFIVNSMKYALKEKGKETEGRDEDISADRTKYDKIVEIVDKISEKS